jgi:hypothetical protein
MLAMDTTEPPMDARPDGTQPPSAPSRRIEISLTQLLAGSAAAACGAWLASKIGVAGTVIGAAIVSALVTTLSAIYTPGARRAQARLPLRKAEVHDRARLPATYSDDPPPPAPEPPAEGYHWGRIALAALAVFVVAMVAVTAIELVKGQTFSCSSAGRNCDQGTTLLPGRARTHPTSPTPTPTTPTPTPTTTPSVVPSSGSGTPSPTGSPSPTFSPTGSPSTSGTPSGTGSPSPAATTG